MYWVQVTNKKGLLLLATREVPTLGQAIEQRDVLERAYPNDFVEVLSRVIITIPKEPNEPPSDGNGESTADQGTDV